jgi:hypothetical protein
MAEIKDRIGGSKVYYNYQKSMRNLEKLQGRILEYEKLKMRFLREQKIDISTAESEGVNNPNNDADDEDENPHSHRLLNSEGSSRSSKNSEKKPKEFDMNTYEELTFLKGHTKFRNFHG